jgi:hypothetical protein
LKAVDGRKENERVRWVEGDLHRVGLCRSPGWNYITRVYI